MSYLSKLAPFSLTEKFKLLKFTIGSRMINKIPRGLKYSYLLTNRLLNQGVKVNRVGGSIEFNYPINETKATFHLKRESSDAQVFEQIVELEEYLPILKKFKEKNITPQTMIDAGANIGLTTVYFKAFFPTISIIAIEPSEETFKRLSKNVKLNNFDHVVLLNKGLWSSPKRLKADQSFRDGQDWSFRLVEASANEPALFEATSIDEIITENKLTTIDFLKIDIEGGEVEIFKDFSKLQWLKQVNVIALEIHDEFDCREHIETNLAEIFELSHAGELTIGINKSFE